MRGGSHWHYYRETDAVIAARGFDGNPHVHKPATKLYNAWLAGVPFLAAPDSAFRAERRSPDDFLAVHDAAELFEKLRLLKNAPELAARMRTNAAARAKDFT